MKVIVIALLGSLYNLGCGSESKDGTGDTSVADSATSATETAVAGDSAVSDSAAADTAVAVDSTTVADSATSPSDSQVADSAADSTTSATDTSATETSATDASEETTQTGSCEDADDCTVCNYATAPATVADCFCVICPDVTMSKTQCDANAAAWEATCAGPKWQDTAQCPVPRCIMPPAPTCEDKQCVAGAEPACGADEDCQRCVYDKPVASAADCYCLFCGTPMDKTTCAANQASYQQFCDPWPGDPCPAVSCIFPGPPICDEAGACADHPDGCNFPEDCTSCPYSQVPKSPEECQCPMCPQPHSQSFCADVAEANDTVCADFDFDACLPPPCAFPGESTCGPEQRCVRAEDR